MCLLIWKSKSGNVPEQYIRTAFERNPHGGGFAYADGSQVHVERGFTKLKKFVKALRKTEGMPTIIHMRIATTGSICRENCHPFEAGGGWWMGHNGIISNVKPINDESDTRAFIREHLEPMLSHNPRALIDDQNNRWNVERIIGYSKMVFMNANGDKVILKEGEGHWIGGVWYSNHSYSDYSFSQNTRCNNRRNSDSDHWVDRWGHNDHRSSNYYQGGKTYPFRSAPDTPRTGPVEFTPPSEEKWDATVKGTLTLAYQMAVKRRERIIANSSAIDVETKLGKGFIPVNQSGVCDICYNRFHDDEAVFWEEQALMICHKCAHNVTDDTLTHKESLVDKGVEEFMASQEEFSEKQKAKEPEIKENKEELRVIGVS